MTAIMSVRFVDVACQLYMSEAFGESWLYLRVRVVPIEMAAASMRSSFLGPIIALSLSFDLVATLRFCTELG